MTIGQSLDGKIAEIDARLDELADRVTALEVAPPPVEPPPVEPPPVEPPPVEPPPVEPPPVEPPVQGGSVRQFLTYDGASGPNLAYWNVGVELAWRNRGVGDWRDATGTEQGVQAFAVAEIAAVGPVSWGVTALASKQVSGENRGFFLRADGTAFRFEFAGRRAADIATRPVLRVVTDQGEFVCPATANAAWAIASYGVTETSALFSVQRGQVNAIVQFDLSAVTGAVQLATMTMTVVGTPRAGTVAVFEADPPAYQTGRGAASVYGLAEQFPADVGLRNHADVIFASDFTDGNGNPSFAGWRVDGLPNLLIDHDTGLPFHRRKFAPGDYEPNGNHGDIRLVNGLEDYGHKTDSVVDEAFFRYRVRLGEDWRSVVDANKMPGFDLGFGYWRTQNNGYWQQVAGNGGVRGDGKLRPSWHRYPGSHPLADQSIVAHHGHMTRGHGGKFYPGNPLSERFVWLGTYMYHIDQIDQYYGDGLRWGNAVMERGRWHDIEHHIRVNSLTGPVLDEYGNQEAVPDGVYEVWLDGVSVFRRDNMRWRRHPETSIESIFTGWYHGGKFPTNIPMTVDVGHFVVARQYIGPVKV